MTFEQIKALIDIVCEKGLQKLEVERSDFRVKITGPAPPTVVGTTVQAPVVSQVVPSAAVAQSAPAPAAAAPAEDRAAGHVITSPIVGTLYQAPSPDAEPYARVGDRVTAGKVLCIVEAMKLMNEIESDVDGEILEIIPSNAQPVEFGEPLFVIRVDS